MGPSRQPVFEAIDSGDDTIPVELEPSGDGDAFFDSSSPHPFIESVPFFENGRYAVGEVLGSGGMSHVTKAYDTVLDKPVALKKDKYGDEKGAKGLAREYEILSKISHLNVVAVHDLGRLESDSRVYVAMELIDGISLREWLKEAHSWQDVLHVFMKAGDGLVATHNAGFVHRDFKPGNVMVMVAEGDLQVKIIDYDLARKIGEPATDECADHLKRTEIRKPAGTIAYMPPEQYGAGPLDAKADQFNFCASLYEALYGERFYKGNSASEMLLNIQGGNFASPVSSFVPDEIRVILQRGLDPDPNLRWPSMKALLAAIQGVLESYQRRQVEDMGVVATTTSSFDNVVSIDPDFDDMANSPEGSRSQHKFDQVGDSSMILDHSLDQGVELIHKQEEFSMQYTNKRGELISDQDSDSPKFENLRIARYYAARNDLQEILRAT